MAAVIRLFVASCAGMTCRQLAAASVLLLLLTPRVVAAQPAKAPVRLGFLSSSSPDRDARYLVAFRQTLRALGYVEGKTLTIDVRYGHGRFEQLPALAAELVGMKVNVLVVAGAPAAHAAKNATRTIPIVMTNAADPVGTGLVASLARPGGNITGLSDFNTGVVAKRLELLKEIVPAATRVGVLSNPRNPTNPTQVKLTLAAAPALGLTVLTVEAGSAAEIDRAFGVLAAERVSALLVIGDPLLGAEVKRIVGHAQRLKLPGIYSTPRSVAEGGLIGYGSSFEDLYRRAAVYVDKVIKGARPADLPIEQPSKFELAVNLKTARTLGLTIPASIVLRADALIE